MTCGHWIATGLDMPRKPTISQSLFPYGVTSRSNNKEWFQIPLLNVWDIFADKIKVTGERYGFVTHAFVLMSNHYHWLLSTPQSNIGRGMRYFMTETSREIARTGGRINKIFGSRYKSSLIGNPVYYANSFRYIYQNPLRAGICKNVFQYPWSTLTNGRIAVAPCLKFNERIPTDEKIREHWLNTIPDCAYNELMRKALRRTEFQFPYHPTKKTYVSGLEFL
jgi:putative transposase